MSISVLNDSASSSTGIVEKSFVSNSSSTLCPNIKCQSSTHCSSEFPVTGYTCNSVASDCTAEIVNKSGSTCNNSDADLVSSADLTNSQSQNFRLWHNRLGHPQSSSVISVLKLCHLPTPTKTTYDLCKACCYGKAHKLPSHPSTTTYNSPFELVFSDLWGPSPIKSSSGYSYYISFIDAYSRYTWLFLLKEKSGALDAFNQFLALAATQFNSTIKSIQTDWGGEFRPFSRLLASKGIHHRIICPHTHHQNGVVERKHRHITEIGLTLMVQAS